MLIFKNTRHATVKTGPNPKAGLRDADELAREIDRRVEQEACDRVTRMLATFQALGPGWQDKLHNDLSFILQAALLRYAIQTVTRLDTTRENHELRFQASSLFLRDCHHQLTSDPNGHERLDFVTGTISQGVRILSRVLTLDTEKASAAYVRANPQTTHAAIVQLVERDGHQPLGMWHSHIMCGANSTRPSSVDLANQDRFCAIGWDEVIGGIFSLDGYFRAYSTAHDFAFEVYGKGAEIVSQAPRETIIKLDMGRTS
jgi:hypothetical protein